MGSLRNTSYTVGNPWFWFGVFWVFLMISLSVGFGIMLYIPLLLIAILVGCREDRRDWSGQLLEA